MTSSPTPARASASPSACSWAVVAPARPPWQRPGAIGHRLVIYAVPIRPPATSPAAHRSAPPRQGWTGSAAARNQRARTCANQRARPSVVRPAIRRHAPRQGAAPWTVTAKDLKHTVFIYFSSLWTFERTGPGNIQERGYDPSGRRGVHAPTCQDAVFKGRRQKAEGGREKAEGKTRESSPPVDPCESVLGRKVVQFRQNFGPRF